MKIKLSHLKGLIREAVAEMLSRQQVEQNIEIYFSSLEQSDMAASEGVIFEFAGEDQDFLVGAIDRYQEQSDQSMIDYQIFAFDESSGTYSQMMLDDLSGVDADEIQSEAERQLNSY